MFWPKNNQNKDLSLLLVTNIITPYKIPVYNYLDKEIDLKVFFLGEKEKNRKWEVLKSEIKFKYWILEGWHFFFQSRDWGLHINFDLIPKLMQEKFNVVVLSGYESPAYWLALLYAKITGKKVVFWNGSTLLSSRSNNWITNWLRKLFIRSADAYLAYGTLARDFLVSHGAKSDKIAVGCNTVDIKKFQEESRRILPERDKIKREKGLPRLNIIFSGQLIERKGLQILLDAFRNLGRNDIGLIVVGDGPEKEKYLNYCRENKIKNVFFEGYQSSDKLFQYYSLADILVCPSLIEVWGLVVNEAMACGLPVVCSNKVGASKDLVKDGINGYIYNAADSRFLRNCLKDLLNSEEKRVKMGEESRKIISSFDSEAYAESLLKAVYLTL